VEVRCKRLKSSAMWHCVTELVLCDVTMCHWASTRAVTRPHIWSCTSVTASSVATCNKLRITNFKKIHPRRVDFIENYYSTLLTNITVSFIYLQFQKPLKSNERNNKMSYNFNKFHKKITVHFAIVPGILNVVRCEKIHYIFLIVMKFRCYKWDSEVLYELFSF
jgi:hypothetical protein